MPTIPFVDEAGKIGAGLLAQIKFDNPKTGVINVVLKVTDCTL